MRTNTYSLDNVDVMIGFLEQKIEANAVTPKLLGAMQKRLDVIDKLYRNDALFSEYYPRMLELQALIYGEGNQESKALEFLDEAVRQAGGAHGLQSKLVKQYILRHKRHVATVAQSRHVPSVQVVDKSASAPRKKRKFFVFSKMKVGFAAAFGLVAISAATLAFVPHAFGLSFLVNHSKISAQKRVYDDLTAQYKSCSSSLANEHGTIDPNDTTAVDTYNQATAKCQTVLQQQKQAADQFDKLVAAK
jgi:hypothetical protein